MQFLYQFNKLGNLTKRHLNVKEASIAINVNEYTIYTAIKNGFLVKGAFHFSYDKNFKIPKKSRNNFEPLFHATKLFGEKIGYIHFHNERCYAEKPKNL